MTRDIRRPRRHCLLWLGVALLGCHEPLVWEPPPPVEHLHEKQKMTPEQTARRFYEAVLQKKEYREFLDLASKRMIQRGPDKEHLEKILSGKSYPDVTGVRLTQEGKERCRVELTAGEASIVFDLVRENLRWRVDRFDPAPAQWELPLSAR